MSALEGLATGDAAGTRTAGRTQWRSVLTAPGWPPAAAIAARGSGPPTMAVGRTSSGQADQEPHAAGMEALFPGRNHKPILPAGYERVQHRRVAVAETPRLPMSGAYEDRHTRRLLARPGAIPGFKRAMNESA
jgi:hypothetical protein